MFGVHAWGVSVPKAAAVAEITAGLLRLVHIAKGGTLLKLTLSMIVAAVGPPALVDAVPVAASVLGAVPKLHVMDAPLTT